MYQSGSGGLLCVTGPGCRLGGEAAPRPVRPHVYARLMRVHAVQVAYGDDEPVAVRRERVADLVRAQVGADLVVLPELWAPTGFDYTRWAAEAEPVDGPTITAISAAARELGASVHAGSIIERDEQGQLWNTSVLLAPDGSRLARYRKIHRFGFGAGEPKLLQPGVEIVTADLAVNAREPDGPRVRVGLATCYDLRFPEQFRALLDAGAELVLVPAAWPAARVAHWTLLGQARAIENQFVVVQVNTAGTHARHEMGGNSQLVDAGGAILSRAGIGEEVLVVDVDLADVARTRSAFPVLADRRL